MSALLLLLFPFFPVFSLSPAHAQALPPNSAAMALDSTVGMALRFDQAGGGCWPGYAWHAVHGGCRRQELEQRTHTQACPADQSGQQTRTDTRYRYLLQATGQAADEPWITGAWDSSACLTPESPWPPLDRRIAESVQVAYAVGTGFGAGAAYAAHLMLHKGTGRLWCYASISAYEAGPQATTFEYPESGRMYADTYQLNLQTQCLPQGSSVLLGGADSGLATISLRSVSHDGCLYHFHRETHTQTSYPTPFEPLVKVC